MNLAHESISPYLPLDLMFCFLSRFVTFTHETPVLSTLNCSLVRPLAALLAYRILWIDWLSSDPVELTAAHWMSILPLR